MSSFASHVHRALNRRPETQGSFFSEEDVAASLRAYESLALSLVTDGEMHPDWRPAFADFTEDAPDRSQLLLRILALKALPRFAPPVSFGRANFAPIDSPATVEHRVSAWPQAQGIAIDDAEWEVVTRNEPAVSMEALLDDRGAFDEREFLQLCAEGPQWEVRHSHWPSFILEIGRVRGLTGPRQLVLDEYGRATLGDVRAGHWGPVRLLDQSPFPAYEADGWCLRKSAHWVGFDPNVPATAELDH